MLNACPFRQPFCKHIISGQVVSVGFCHWHGLFQLSQWCGGASLVTLVVRRLVYEHVNVSSSKLISHCESNCFRWKEIMVCAFLLYEVFDVRTGRGDLNDKHAITKLRLVLCVYASILVTLIAGVKGHRSEEAQGAF